jgi:DNA-binding MarR family transcriptional regulator
MPKVKAKGEGKKASKTPDAAKILERSPSHLLHRALQVALDIYAEEIGPDAVTQRQYAVLSAVAAHEGLTQTDLVRTTGIDRSTLADLVARMIGKSLLARQRSAADARANTVSLTDQGREALNLAAPRVAAADERILKLLPARKRDAFLDVLKDMSQAAQGLDEPAVEEPAVKLKKKKDKAPKAAKLGKPAKAAKSADGAPKLKAAKPAKLKTPKAAKAKKPKKVADLEPAGAA